MKIEIITDRENVQFPIIIKDKKGNTIYRQYENGFWWESTYDDNNNVLTCKNSEGYWWEKIFDEKGNELTRKGSDGDYRIKGKDVTKEEYEAFINNK
jgi:hypothetical protein